MTSNEQRAGFLNLAHPEVGDLAVEAQYRGIFRFLVLTDIDVSKDPGFPDRTFVFEVLQPGPVKTFIHMEEKSIRSLLAFSRFMLPDDLFQLYGQRLYDQRFNR